MVLGDSKNPEVGRYGEDINDKGRRLLELYHQAESKY